MKLAYIVKQLTDNDVRVLKAIERGMPTYEYVPLEFIEKHSRLRPNELSYSIMKINRLKLIKRRIGDYVGYMLTPLGYDCLALKSLIRRNIVSALGPKLGVGKESDVYEALTPTGLRITIKLHKVGRISFRHTRRWRTYTVDKPNVSWLIESKIAAEREYTALNLTYEAKVHVPKPIARDRHIVVTEFIEGILLVKYKNTRDPEGLLYTILDDIRKTYLKAEIVHGDLSEYNILVKIIDEKEEPLIIDWPQYVERTHPSAESLLKRDVEYIVKYFYRRYNIRVDVARALDYVRGKIEKI